MMLMIITIRRGIVRKKITSVEAIKDGCEVPSGVSSINCWLPSLDVVEEDLTILFMMMMVITSIMSMIAELP